MDEIDVADLSREEVKAFLESPIWRLMRKHLAERLDMLLKMIEIAPLDDVWGETKEGRPILEREGVRRIQGAITEVRFLMALPESYLDELNELSKEKEEYDERK